MKIEIDQKSGFCFGVQRAIDKAEELLSDHEKLYCLGDIVHNQEEIQRLSKLGMQGISEKDIQTKGKNKKILIRSHGAHPGIYEKINSSGAVAIDATCPVVLKLQQRVKKSYLEQKEKNGQLLIYGKQGHPEVIGLCGQTNDQAIVVSKPDDLQKIDFERPIELYAQTTMPLDGFQEIVKQIKTQAKDAFIVHDSVCRQVANRVPHLKGFAKKHDVILFVSGKKSSNGKLLFEICKNKNKNSHFISSPEEVKPEWFKNAKSAGICGATSTPNWLMNKVAEKIQNL